MVELEGGGGVLIVSEEKGVDVIWSPVSFLFLLPFVCAAAVVVCRFYCFHCVNTHLDTDTKSHAHMLTKLTYYRII